MTIYLFRPIHPPRTFAYYCKVAGLTVTTNANLLQRLLVNAPVQPLY